MPPGNDKPSAPADAPPDDQMPTRRRQPRVGRSLRFAQARSIGIILVLVTLLALVVYNTIATGTPWATRDADVRLLMTLLSILLGIDVVIGNHRAIARIIGRGLLNYADTDDDPPAYVPPRQYADDATDPSQSQSHPAHAQPRARSPRQRETDRPTDPDPDHDDSETDGPDRGSEVNRDD